MARLTEEMVIARSRVSDLGAIKKLNCWGGELVDVSILRRMHNLEVLSMSVNKIASLSDLQYCKSLKELYMRSNEIRTLNEVCYLQELPKLKILWLGENPCAKEDLYRLTVLRALPELEKLDDLVVQPEEREDAARKGRVLLHPESEEAILPPIAQRPHSLRGSNHQVASPPVAEYEETYDDERYRTPPARRPSETISESLQSPANVANGSDNGSLCEKCCSPLSPECEWQTPPETNGHTNHINSPSTTNTNGVNASSPTTKPRYVEQERRGSSCSSNGSGISRSRNGSPPYRRTEQEEDTYRYNSSSSTNVVHSQPKRLNKIEASNQRYTERLDWAVMDYVNGSSGSLNDHQRRPISDLEPRRSTTTTKANLLTAVICLIMELDYEGLVHVEKMVRRRRDEISEHYQPS